VSVVRCSGARRRGTPRRRPVAAQGKPDTTVAPRDSAEIYTAARRLAQKPDSTPIMYLKVRADTAWAWVPGNKVEVAIILPL
jgi:hypothetical protein